MTPPTLPHAARLYFSPRQPPENLLAIAYSAAFITLFISTTLFDHFAGGDASGAMFRLMRHEDALLKMTISNDDD